MIDFKSFASNRDHNFNLIAKRLFLKMRAFIKSACVICSQNESSYVSALSNGRAVYPAWLCTLYTYRILQTINATIFTGPCFVNLFKWLS